MSNINIAVVSSKVYNTEEVAHEHCKFLLKSCEIHNINLLRYGFPCTHYPGHVSITTTLLLDFIKTLDYTHILFTDSPDSFFTSSLDEIIRKYNAFGNPEMLTSTSNVFFPANEWNTFPLDSSLEEYKNKYYPSDTEYFIPQVGGYIAEIPYLIDIFTKMLLKYSNIYGDNANIWRDAWHEGWFRPERDTHCEIFQNFFDKSKDNLQMKNDKLYNVVTDSYPCVLHISAGYADPQTGKEYKMRPIWQMIYPEVKV